MKLFLLSFLLFVECHGFRPSIGGRMMMSRQILSMNMFDRFIRVVSSNVNKVIKDLEDPEKVLDQAVNDMQSDLIKIRQSYAEISATQKRMQSQKQNADTLVNVCNYIYIYILSSSCYYYSTYNEYAILMSTYFLYLYMVGLVSSCPTCTSSG